MPLKDYGLYPPPMDAQAALTELQKHLLGEDWYIVDPMCNRQANAIIVAEIERRYRRVKPKRTLRQKLILLLGGKLE